MVNGGSQRRETSGRPRTGPVPALGKPVLETGTRRRCRLRPADAAPAVTTAASPPAASRRRLLACPLTGLPNTYVLSAASWWPEDDYLTRCGSFTRYMINSSIAVV